MAVTERVEVRSLSEGDIIEYNHEEYRISLIFKALSGRTKVFLVSVEHGYAFNIKGTQKVKLIEKRGLDL